MTRFLNRQWQKIKKALGFGRQRQKKTGAADAGANVAAVIGEVADVVATDGAIDLAEAGLRAAARRAAGTAAFSGAGGSFGGGGASGDFGDAANAPATDGSALDGVGEALAGFTAAAGEILGKTAEGAGELVQGAGEMAGDLAKGAAEAAGAIIEGFGNN